MHEVFEVGGLYVNNRNRKPGLAVRIQDGWKAKSSVHVYAGDAALVIDVVERNYPSKGVWYHRCCQLSAANLNDVYFITLINGHLVFSKASSFVGGPNEDR